MIGMQYKITLPNDYDMNVIRKRVKENGTKTDNFKELIFKAYLIADYPKKKEYAPLYLWKSNEGMNKFIFDGFYDNIIESFGWQNINIGIPYLVDLKQEISIAAYILEIENEFYHEEKMSIPTLTYEEEQCLGKVIIYNPDKWKYVEFYFYENIPNKAKGQIYEVLHLSL